MAKKGDKSGSKSGDKSADKNGDKNGDKGGKNGKHAATPGPPAPASEPLGSGEAGRSRAPAATTGTTTAPAAPPPMTAASTTTAPAVPTTTSVTSTPPAPSTSPTPSTRSESASPARPRPAAPATGATPARGGTVTDEITQALLLPVQVAQRVLPARRVPVYLGAAALAVIGVIEWPVALGAGLAWEALRRWGPDRSARQGS